MKPNLFVKVMTDFVIFLFFSILKMTGIDLKEMKQQNVLKYEMRDKFEFLLCCGL